MLVEKFLVAPGTMELARLPIHTHSEQACELSCHTAVSPRDRTASWDLISSVPPLRHVVEALRTCYWSLTLAQGLQFGDELPSRVSQLVQAGAVRLPALHQPPLLCGLAPPPKQDRATALSNYRAGLPGR
jgi:hypothetical protein